MTAIFRAYRQAYAGLPREAWLLSAVIFANRCGTMVLPFLTLYLRTEQGFSPAAAGQMLAVYGLGGIVGTQLGGRLTHAWSGVGVAFLGLALSVPGFLAIPYAGAGWGLVAALLYLSIVFEAMRPAIATATTEFCPPEMHTKAFALNRLAMNLGMSVGPAVGGVLASAGGYHLLFFVNACGAAAAAVLTVCAFDVMRPHATSEPAAPNSQPSRRPYGDRHYLAFLGLQLAGAMVFFQVIGVMPLFWKEQWSMSEAQIGALWAINTLLVVVFEMVLTDRLGRHHPLRWVSLGGVLICLGFGGSLLGSGFGFACLLTLVWTAGEMLSAPFSLTYVARCSEGGRRGEYMGLFSTTMATALVLAPIVGAWLYEMDPYLPWQCCLAMAVVLPLGYAWLSHGAKRSPPAAGQLGPAV